MRVTDAVLGKLVVDIPKLLAAMTPDQRRRTTDGNREAIQRDSEMCDVFVPHLSAGHAEAEVPHQTSHGDAIRKKMTAASPIAA